MSTTPTAAALVAMIRNALDFANRAAGEGIEIDGLSPEDFLMEYSDATGDEDWDCFPDRIAAIVSAALSPAATEPVAWQQRHHDGSWLMCPKGWNAKDRDDWPAIYRPLYAAPPSPVTVEAAAVAALSAYQQADMDGTMVLVSRQAIEECLPALRALAGERS